MARRKLDKIKAEKLATCNMCGNCCSYGSGYVLIEEIKDLASNLKMNEKEFISKFLEKSHYPRAMKFKIIRKPGLPYGRCVFFNIKNKTCQIHEIKPLHCRIGTCNESGEEISRWFADTYLANNDIEKYGVSFKEEKNGRQNKPKHK